MQEKRKSPHQKRSQNSPSNNKTLNLIQHSTRMTMDNDENLPAQCHPIVKPKKKKTEIKNETV
ncbi:hypothetical protein NADRNF5_1150 [Nitrosopumilus adriaticus]|uniref:Uncharacterized protein n=1 Tax=Nitrosopumilus adriaticus TaxID=1580092 RepID=A0A0D5C229_9ARCH|nr:hypothetical protein NADRNF5_1150 [Nitrosopumilus adriaticus]